MSESSHLDFATLAEQDEGKEKKLNIDFEPFKPINTVSQWLSRSVPP